MIVSSNRGLLTVDWQCASVSCNRGLLTPGLPQWHVKDPGHSAESAGSQLHLNTHTSLTQQSRSGLTMPLSRHNVGTYPETSSHTTCQDTFVLSSQPAQPLWADPGRKNGISMRELVSTSKKKKKKRRHEWMVEYSKILANEEKAITICACLTLTFFPVTAFPLRSMCAPLPESHWSLVNVQTWCMLSLFQGRN